MAAPSEDEFDSWLSQKLQKINVDVDLEVFVQYIRGILETDTTRDDKVESILGLLEEITEDDVQGHSDGIVSQWENSAEKGLKEKQEQEEKEKANLDLKLASIMEKQTLTTVKQKEVNAEAAARKAAILSQYGHVSDGEEDDDNSAEKASHAGSNGGDPLLTKNVNAQMVSLQEREQREKEKDCAEKKKQKDKEDREKQKNKAQERKDAEKKRTQKGERRR